MEGQGPGLVVIVPGVMQMVRVDLRGVTMDVPAQDVISRDNVSVKVNAVVFFRVIDPQRAILQVEDLLIATRELAQTTLRVVPGKHELDEMLAERERRAKVIHAEGEKQASATLLEAARKLAQQPEAMELRYLQTMTQVAGDRGSTIVFPMPTRLLDALLTPQSRAAG